MLNALLTAIILTTIVGICHATALWWNGKDLKGVPKTGQPPKVRHRGKLQASGYLATFAVIVALLVMNRS